MKSSNGRLPTVTGTAAHVTKCVGWLALAAAVLLPSVGHADVEFVVAPIGDCNKVDVIGDGKDLFLQPGLVRFEVWGGGLDIGNSVRITSDDGNVGEVFPSILRAHNGAENLLRGCRQATGSVEVEVSSPADTTSNLQRSLRFRKDLFGNESRLQVTVVAFHTPSWTFNTFSESPARCLTRNIGTIVQDNNNQRLTVTLPAGAATDTSNCTLSLSTRIGPSVTGTEVDVNRTFNYAITGTPNFLSLVPGTNQAGCHGCLAQPRFNLSDIANIRSTTTQRVFLLTGTAPNNRLDTLTLVINPPPTTNAFSQGVVCRNLVTGTTVNADDAFQCELQLSRTPPLNGQLISFEVNDRLCVAAGDNSVTYSSATGIGTTTLPNTGTIHQIDLRALRGSTSNGRTPCASFGGVGHTLKFWIGERDTESGPDFSSTQITIRQFP